METAHAQELAHSLIAAHGLTDWGFAFDRAKRRAGATHYAAKKITISQALVELYTPQEVRAVILHEIAHALVGPGHAHDKVWQRTCLTIGGDGRTRLPVNSPEPQAPWQGVCPAGHNTQRYRRPTQQLSCRKCSRSFNHHSLFFWENTQTGERIAPKSLPLTAARQRRTSTEKSRLFRRRARLASVKGKQHG
ncbi:SprT-like domain-containing protein [Arcanobacterium canis]